MQCSVSSNEVIDSFFLSNEDNISLFRTTNSTVITCRTIQVPKSQNESGSVVVHIDSQFFGDPMVVFQYKANPVFLSVSPRITIPS